MYRHYHIIIRSVVHFFQHLLHFIGSLQHNQRRKFFHQKTMKKFPLWDLKIFLSRDDKNIFKCHLSFFIYAATFSPGADVARERSTCAELSIS